ncbi:MAG: ferrous iron transport protein B [Chloroflexi bacterium]|nr:ferrous iron transport protein B [Chloroflexota bacterium]
MSHCASDTQTAAALSAAIAEHSPMVALAGQPNVGKSTLFNILTGLNQHVGNWPGKTIERKEGVYAFGGATCRLADLPGTYSLTANSMEEVIAREFIIREQPDVVVVVVDAAALERSLYLVAELIALPTRMIVALNMMDVAEQEGYHIEPDALQAALGVPVVPLVATKNVGVRELLQAIHQVARDEIPYAPKPPQIRDDHRAVLNQITTRIAEWTPAPYPRAWVALKLLEGDQEITRMMQAALPADQWEVIYAILRAHDDALMAVAGGRYEWIGRMIRAAVTRPRAGQIGLTERLDRWAAHPLWGIALLAGILGLIFWLTFAIGTPLQNWLNASVIAVLAQAASAGLAGAPAWLSSLVVNGLIGGVGSVLAFLPIMVIFFATMGALEDIGYMARAAYVMDSFMHLMGLHGKSFLPLFLGFGCNVPAVMGARVIESRRARLLTILVTPLIPCTARMAVVAFLAPAFFGGAATLVSWGLVVLSLATLVGVGVVTNRVVFQGQRSAFIMEMPLYHRPNWRTIGVLVWQRIMAFFKKAGTIILAFTLGVWALSTLPTGQLDSSWLADLGRLIEPVGRLMGFDWRLTVALLSSFPAKENSIATLGVLFGAGKEGGLANVLAATIPPSTALAFLAVQLLFIPCMATVATIRQETGSWRWTLFNMAMQLVVSLTAGVVVYHLARLIGG